MRARDKRTGKKQTAFPLFVHPLTPPLFSHPFSSQTRMAAPELTVRNGGPFKGGLYRPAGLPTSVSGTLPPQGLSSVPPLVQVSQVANARDDRGTNATIPYARVVPLNDHGVKKRDRSGNVTNAHVGPTQHLRAGFTAWMLRSKNTNSTIGAQAAHSAALITKLEQVASTEYVNQGKKKQGLTLPDASKRPLAKPLPGPTVYTALNITGDTQANDIGAIHLLDIFDDQMPGGTPATFLSEAKIVSPFLPDRTDLGLNTGLKNLMNDAHNQDIFAIFGNKKFKNLPDYEKEMQKHNGCFATYLLKIHEEELLDWVPDGIVLSRLDDHYEGGSLDSNIDSKMGVLYNIAISGPAMTEEWHEMSAGGTVSASDTIYQCLVADVVISNDEDYNQDLINELKDPSKRDGVYSKGNSYEDREHKQFLMLSADQTTYTIDGVATPQAAIRASQRLNHSVGLANLRYKPFSSSYFGRHNSSGRAKDNCRTQMGMKGPVFMNDSSADKCAMVAEYIIGGWSMGRVIDAAASRISVTPQIKPYMARGSAVTLSVSSKWLSAAAIKSRCVADK